MRHRQANSRAARAALILAAWFLGGAAPVPAVPTRIGPPSNQYDDCLAETRRDPKAAFATAENWRQAGGGFPAQHCAAIALLGLKQYAEAAKRLEELAGIMMRQPAELRAGALDQAGQAWLLAGNPAAAKIDFDGALTFAPRNAEFLIDRAEAYTDAGRYWEAIDDLNRALDLAPKNPIALLYRASAYRNAGGDDGLELALADAEAALKLEPDWSPALLERGNIRRLKGDTKGARADWERVQQLAPNSAAAEYARNNLAHIGENPAAARLLTDTPADR
ncbi:MAG TPA: tetratricopeptide repeat protein [Stellaceae bacterium]|nr:tetratricopeptide repeat protein [Stellaceae bacterium]